LMAGFSFANIADQTRDFLLPLFQSLGQRTDEVMPSLVGPDPTSENTGQLLDDLGMDPITQPNFPGHLGEDDTAALIRGGIAAGRAAPPVPPDDGPRPDAFDDESVTDVRPEDTDAGPHTTWMPIPARAPAGSGAPGREAAA